jgi:hypothetical protein
MFAAMEAVVAPITWIFASTPTKANMRVALAAEAVMPLPPLLATAPEVMVMVRLAL